MKNTITIIGVTVSLMAIMFILGYESGNPCSPSMINGAEQKSEECLTFLFNNIDQ